MIKEYVEAATNAKQLDKQESKHYSRPIAWFETALIVLGLLANLLLLPHYIGYDGWFRFTALSTMLTQSQVPDVKYSMVGPFFSIPFWYLGKLYQTPLWWCSRYNVFVFAAGLLAIFWLLKDRVDRGLLRKFFLLLVVASMFSNHLLYYYGELFTAIFVAVGCVAIVVGPGLAGWCAIILGVVNTPATLLGLILLDAKHMLEHRRVRYALAVIITIALILLESWIRRGNPFETGYTDDHGPSTIMPYSGMPGVFSNPIFFGLISLLFSFGKGICFFAPGLLLPIRRTLRRVQEATQVDLLAVYTLWMAFFVGLLLIYSCYWSWHGGWFWGPRYLLIASIPASFALAVRLQWRDPALWVNIMTVLVLCLSVWVGINGAVYGDDIPQYRNTCLNYNGYFETPLCYYTPEFSVLWYPFVVHQPLNSGQLLYLLYSLLVGAYLLVPLLITTQRQLTAAALEFGQTRLNLRSWRI